MNGCCTEMKLYLEQIKCNKSRSAKLNQDKSFVYTLKELELRWGGKKQSEVQVNLY